VAERAIRCRQLASVWRRAVRGRPGKWSGNCTPCSWQDAGRPLQAHRSAPETAPYRSRRRSRATGPEVTVQKTAPEGVVSGSGKGDLGGLRT